MKQADVKVGGTYLTKIGGRDVRVTVEREETQTRYYAYTEPKQRTVFRVKRQDNGKVMPKARAAAALRPAPEALKEFRAKAWTLKGFVEGSFDTAQEAYAFEEQHKPNLCCRLVIRRADGSLVTETGKTPPEGKRCGIYRLKRGMSFVCETTSPGLMATIHHDGADKEAT
jgi:hypothetical protein